MVKNPPVNATVSALDPCIGKIPWRREWQPTPVFMPGKSHGQRIVDCRWATVHGIAKKAEHDLATDFQDKDLNVRLVFCDPMDCSPPGSSVHGISQARTLEWVAIAFSRGSS